MSSPNSLLSNPVEASGNRAARRAGELLLLAILPALLWAGADQVRHRSATLPGFPVTASPLPERSHPALLSPPPASGSTVSVETALGWQQHAGSGGTGSPAVLWLDARPAADYARGHVPGAVPLNEDEWSALLPGALERWNPGMRVVVYCDGGDCRASERVVARLRDAGVEPVWVLGGGWPAWQRAAIVGTGSPGPANTGSRP